MLTSTARRAAAAVLAAAAPLTALAAPAAAAAPDRYIVQFRSGTDAPARASQAAAAGQGLLHVYRHAFPGFAATMTAAQAAAWAADPTVVAVERDQLMTATDTQNGPTWGLDRLDQRTIPVSGSYAYPAQAGSGVTAYVIDTGIRADHTDFGGRVATGYTAINDGRGTNDCAGHGTHVAGTIAGATYGVAKKATLVPVRILDCRGSGWTSDIVAGINWVIADHQAGTPAVANMSLGGSVSTSLDNAVVALINDGVTTAVAAGNSTADACTSSPAGVRAALTVAASDSNDKQASFSNYGSCVDLYAPGVSITSDYYTSSTASAVMSGTSMASPHVAGAAALLLGANPTWTPAQVTSKLLANATSNAISNATAGTANLLLFSDATLSASAVPAAPTGLTAIPGDGQVTLSWSPVSDATGYQVLRGTLIVATPTTTTFTDTGLTNDTPYTYTVLATNAAGNSAASTAATATPTAAQTVTAPVTPTGLSARISGVGQISLTWNTVTAATSYQVTRNGVPVGSPTSASFTDTELANATAYTYTVAAVNSAGSSAPSTSLTITTAAAPAAATGFTATAGRKSATLRWTLAANGGLALTGQTLTVYRVGTATPIGTSTLSATTTSVTVNGLQTGRSYYFVLTSTNPVGTGPAATSNTITAL